MPECYFKSLLSALRVVPGWGFAELHQNGFGRVKLFPDGFQFLAVVLGVHAVVALGALELSFHGDVESHFPAVFGAAVENSVFFRRKAVARAGVLGLFY